MSQPFPSNQAEAQAELQRLRNDIARLDHARRELEAQLAGSQQPTAPITTTAELSATLRRFLRQGLHICLPRPILCLAFQRQRQGQNSDRYTDCDQYGIHGHPPCPLSMCERSTRLAGLSMSGCGLSSDIAGRETRQVEPGPGLPERDDPGATSAPRPSWYRYRRPRRA